VIGRNIGDSRAVLRNELGRGWRANGGIAEVIERGGEIGLVLLVLGFLLADGILADDGTDPLQFGECFVEAALGGGAVAECKREQRGIDSFVIEGGELERERAVHTPLAEPHLSEKHALGFGIGLPFVVELGADGIQFFEIGSGKALGAEIVLDGIAGRDGFSGLGARPGGGIFRSGSFAGLRVDR